MSDSVSSGSTPSPEQPLPWLWRCHICHATYQLGTTRKCLNDGHYFCSGPTINKRTGKLKKHAPCGSTFDYSGWKEYNEYWHHNDSLDSTSTSSVVDADISSSSETESTTSHTHLCDTGCNFPSECRWRESPTPHPMIKPLKVKKTRIPTASAPTSHPTSTTPHSTRSTSSNSASIQEQSEPATLSKATTEFSIRRSSRLRQRSFSLPFFPYMWLPMASEASQAGIDADSALLENNNQNGASEAESEMNNDGRAGLMLLLEPAPLNITKQFKDATEKSVSTPTPSIMEKTSRYNLRTTRQRLATLETKQQAALVDRDLTSDKQIASPVQMLLDWSFGLDDIIST